jgi:hypothetical protein
VITTRTIIYAALRIKPTLFGCNDGLIESRQLEYVVPEAVQLYFGGSDTILLFACRWAYRFMRRRRLVVRKGTHVGQKLVSQLLDEVVDFADMITRVCIMAVWC